MNKFLSIVVVFSFSFMNLETANAQQNTPEILVQKTFAKDIAEKTSNNLSPASLNIASRPIFGASPGGSVTASSARYFANAL